MMDEAIEQLARAERVIVGVYTHIDLDCVHTHDDLDSVGS